MTVSEFGEQLKTITVSSTALKFAHFAWSKTPDGDYGTYSEEDAEDFCADGVHGEYGTIVYVNYFTRNDTGAVKTAVETKFNSLDIPWHMNTIQYENDSGFIHYEWIVTLYG